MSDPNPDTNIQAARPPVPDSTAIQENRPAQAAAAALQQSAFLARLRHLLQMYSDMGARRSNPTGWLVIQIGFVIIGFCIATSLYQDLAGKNVDPDLAGVLFLLICLLVAAVPDGFLYLLRRMRRSTALGAIEEFIIMTVNTYPQEIEQVGGVNTLADPVELEALVHVLEDKFRPPATAQTSA